MSKTTAEALTPSLAAISCETAQEAMGQCDKLQRRLMTLFAERRVLHIQNGADQDALTCYDYVVKEVIEAASKGDTGLCVRLEAMDEDDMREKAQPYVAQIADMLTTDGFKVSFRNNDVSALSVQIDDSEAVTLKRRQIREILIDVSWGNDM